MSKTSDTYVTLSEYVSNMKKNQKSIYYLTGSKIIELKNSPLLEVCNKKGLQVLLMDHEIDEMTFGSVQKYKEYDFKSINHANALEEIQADEEQKDQKIDIDPFIKKVKKVLGDKVKDVVASKRLSDSPSCVVADSNDPTAQMQELMRSMGQADIPNVKPILEINPNHKIIKKLKGKIKQKSFNDIAFLLYEQALIQEGVKLDNPAEFTERLNKVIIETL